MSNTKPFILREHQDDAVSAIEGSIDLGSDNLVVRAVTSFGKSAVIAKIAEKYKDDGVMIIVNITALIDQISEHLDHFNVDHSILKAGRKDKFDPSKKVQIVMAQTLYARIKDTEFDHAFRIWAQDEIHKEYNTKRTKELIEKIKPEVRVGFTATPWTAEGYALDGTELLETVTDDYLTEKGYLSPIKYYIPRWAEDIDYSKVKMTAGEYNTADLDLIIGSESYIKSMIESMNKLNIKEENKKFLVFTTTTEMADRITHELKEDGYNVEAYHSKIHKKTLENIMESFKDNTPYKGPHQEDRSLFDTEVDEQNEIRGLVSVSKIAVGFSVSDIDVGIIARAIGSMNLWPQVVGRMKRTHEGKTHADILDLGKNISRNGFPEDPYSPPERTGQKDIDKIALSTSKEHLAMENMIAALQSDDPELMTREKYNLIIEELIRNKKRLTLMEPVELHNKIQVSEDPVEIIAALAVLFDKEVCDDRPDKWGRQSRGYVAKNGKEVVGFVNPDSIGWMSELWSELLPTVPEYYRKKYLKSLKTRAKNMLNDKSSIWGIRFFIEYLMEQDETERAILDSIDQNDANTELDFSETEDDTPYVIEYEGFDDNIPF